MPTHDPDAPLLHWFLGHPNPLGQPSSGLNSPLPSKPRPWPSSLPFNINPSHQRACTQSTPRALPLPRHAAPRPSNCRAPCAPVWAQVCAPQPLLLPPAKPGKNAKSKSNRRRPTDACATRANSRLLPSRRTILHQKQPPATAFYAHSACWKYEMYN